MYQLFYALIATLTTIVSGLLPLNPRIPMLSQRYVVAFASGVVIGTSLFEMFPKGDIAANWLIAGFGFFSFYLLEMVITIHTCGQDECEPKSIGFGAILGISLDNLVDGAAIAVGYLIDPILGLFIALAVVAHEFP